MLNPDNFRLGTESCAITSQKDLLKPTILLLVLRSNQTYQIPVLQQVTPFVGALRGYAN